jgi:2-amino-4-hydroxy-6-hydroxymethyldihydropteridine diphosphokinase
MATRAAVGLGSNLGDRRALLAAAVQGLAAGAGTVVAVSSLYETEPIGGPRQGPYLNAVVVVDTALGPRSLLELCLGLEQDVGRVRRVRWEARALDVDVLLYDGIAVAEPGLSVPHPRMRERRFVLEPLVEAWPEAAFPGGARVSDLLPGLSAQLVEVLASPGWWDQPGPAAASPARGSPA